jgi:hypothetical protein
MVNFHTANPNFAIPIVEDLGMGNYEYCINYDYCMVIFIFYGQLAFLRSLGTFFPVWVKICSKKNLATLLLRMTIEIAC